MIKEAFDYMCEKKSSISHIYFMVYMTETFKAFGKEVAAYRSERTSAEKKTSKKRRSLYSQAKPTLATDNPKKSFTIKKLTVNISCGDITDSSCDIIVNPTDSKITLTGQGVAGAILRKGGKELQELCHALTSNGKVLDESTLVIKTRAVGSLKAKHIFHICFEGSDSENCF